MDRNFFRAAVVTVVMFLVCLPAFGVKNLKKGTVKAELGRAGNYVIVDTDQSKCYNNSMEISCPQSGQFFYGQDAQYDGVQPSYVDLGNGTVTDLNTGLMWQKTPGEKVTFAQAVSGVSTFNLAGYTDWRLPNIKELYSLILFSGTDPSGPESAIDPVPFIDTDYFVFGYGDESAGERIIDAQYWSSTEYVSTTMGGSATTFGVNFADGRIKGYGREFPGGGQMFQFVRYVRGSSDYGQNDFVNNGDGTVTDQATALMWQKADNGNGYNWQEALNYAENLELAGYGDWRLPNAKELQSIVDYTRSPATTGSAAINPVFTVTSIVNEAGQTDYPCYWTGTTHASARTGQEGGNAAYVAFGRAMGYMNGQWQDVHGAGAQRSDPKAGDPGDYPFGHGPQGDAIRIYNFIRCVRDAGVPPENQAPDTPRIPNGSSSGGIDTEYMYTSSTRDPEGDDMYYLFDWGDGTDSGWIGPYGSGVQVNVLHTWSEAGLYEVKVKAKDVNGNESGWSDVLVVSIDGDPEERTGDVNNDGHIDILDVLSVVFHLLEMETLTGDALNRANCDGRGEIDILDVLGIVNVLLGIGECEP